MFNTQCDSESIHIAMCMIYHTPPYRLKGAVPAMDECPAQRIISLGNL